MDLGNAVLMFVAVGGLLLGFSPEIAGLLRGTSPAPVSGASWATDEHELFDLVSAVDHKLAKMGVDQAKLKTLTDPFLPYFLCHHDPAAGAKP